MKKPRRRADKAITTQPDGDVAPSSLDQAKIARRAFEIYCDRGCLDGHDLDDWLMAERELRAATGSSAE